MVSIAQRFIRSALFIPLIVSLLPCSDTLAESSAPRVFSNVSGNLRPRKGELGVLRERSFFKMNSDALLGASGRVLVDLPGVNGGVEAVREGIQPGVDGAITWIGHLLDSPSGDSAGEVSLTYIERDKRRGYSGRISTRDGRLYVITQNSAGRGFIQEMDAKRTIECGTGKETYSGQSARAAVTASSTLRPRSLGDEEIDLLVAYTTEAKAAAGGLEGIAGLINEAVADTNTAFQNSAVGAHVNLVHTVETLGFIQDKSSYDADIRRLRDPNDPSLFLLHQLRQEHRADVVLLIAAPRDYCGLGLTMRNPSLEFKSSAFAIVSTACAVAQLSFTHELGHFLGAAHERGSANNNGGSYPFSYGYRAPTGNWRDIMAIGTGQRILHFSNPEVLYGGLPTGVSEGDPLAADNAKTLNLNASYVSYFKDTSGATFSVGGTVRDAVTLQPLEGVSIPSGGPLGQTATDQDGVYSFDAILPGAPYTIVPSLLGYDFSPSAQSGAVNGNLVFDFVGVENLPTVGPDLVVDEGKISGKLVQSSRLKFKAKVFNLGAQSVLANRDFPQIARLRLCLNVVGPGPYEDCFFVASKAVSGTLKPRRSKTVSFSTPWTAQRGNHAYEICADKSAISGAPHRVLETDEQNNCYYRSFTVE